MSVGSLVTTQQLVGTLFTSNDSTDTVTPGTAWHALAINMKPVTKDNNQSCTVSPLDTTELFSLKLTTLTCAIPVILSINQSMPCVAASQVWYRGCNDTCAFLLSQGIISRFPSLAKEVMCALFARSPVGMAPSWPGVEP